MMSSFKKVLIILLTVFLCVWSFVLTLKGAVFFGFDLADLRNPDQALKSPTIAVILFIHLIPILLILFSQKIILRNSIQDLGFSKIFLKPMIFGLFFGVIVKVVATSLVYLKSNLVEISWTLNQVSLSEWLPYFLWYLTALNLNSLNEELIYRVFPISNLSKINPAYLMIFVFASAILFSGIHFVLEDPDVLRFVYRFLFGVLTGLIFISYKSLWMIVGFHTGWNFIALSFSDGSWKEGGLFKFTNLSSNIEIIANIAVLALSILIFYFFKIRGAANFKFR